MGLRRAHTYKLYRQTKTKVINITAALALLAGSFSGIAPLLFSNGAAANSVVTPVSNQNWYTRDTDAATGSSLQYVPVSGAPLGSGALELQTSSSNDSVVHLTHDFNLPLNTVSKLSYETKQLSAADTSVGNATLRVAISYDGGATTDQLMYEPYYNGFAGASGWQTWDLTQGKFWSNNAYSYNGKGGVDAGSDASNFSLADVLANHSDATVTGLILSMGTYNPSQQVLVDNVVLNDNVYDFDPATVAACTTTTTVPTTDLSTWDLSQTRANGHNVLTSNGLHVYTDGSTDTGARTDGGVGTWNTDKAAGYYTTDFALADAGVPSISFANYTGGRPGLQLGIDKDGNGTRDAYLVYEPWAYGDGNYWSNTYLGVPAGQGYASFGTLNDYLAANPSARIVQVGYSLGSGVLGNAVISKITAGCADYTFATPPLTSPTNLTPASGSYTNNLYYDNSWTAVNGAAKYAYQWSRSDAVDNTGALTGAIGYTDSGTYDQSTPGTVVRHNGFTSDGIYYWQVRALDADGNTGPWSAVSKLTVDTVNPTVSITSPTADQVISGHTVTIKGTAADDNLNYYYCYVSGPNGEVGTRDAQCTTAWAAGTPFQSVFADSATGTTDGTLGTITLPGSLADGTYTVHVVAKDKAGNTTEATQNFVLDNTAPAVPAATLTADNTGNMVPNGGSTDSQHFTFHLPAGADHYQLKYWNDIPGSAFNGEANAWNPTDLSAYMTGNDYHDSFTQGEGTHYFAFSACDAAGNCSAYSDPFVVTYDKTAPNVPTNLAWTDSNGHVVANNGSTNLAGGTASWQDSSSDVDHYIYKYWNDISSSPYNSETNAWTTNVSGTSLHGVFNQGEGTNFFCVEAVDMAGNTSACSTVFTITYDTTAPAEPTANPGAGTYTSTQLVNLSSTDTSGTAPTIYYTTDGSAPSSTHGTVYTGAFTVSSSETVKAIAYDVAGNASGVLTAAYVINSGSSSSTTNTDNSTKTTTNNIVFTNTSAQVATTGNATNTGNGTGGNAQTGDATNTNGSVLGASTTNDDSGQVKGDSTVNLQNASKKNTGAFLGLGWWWLAILAALAAILAATRRRADNS